MQISSGTAGCIGPTHLRRQSTFHNPTSQITLISGGARSGKSTCAQELARARHSKRILMIATAEGADDEMRKGIARHRAERAPEWDPLQAPRELPRAFATPETAPEFILPDSLTLWVSNELRADETDLEHRLFGQLDLVLEWTHLHEIDLLFVSNKVGWGILPDNELARRFRDVLGRVNYVCGTIRESSISHDGRIALRNQEFGALTSAREETGCNTGW